MTVAEEVAAEYRALVVQVASWAMRQQASKYVPVAQTLDQFAMDVAAHAS